MGNYFGKKTIHMEVLNEKACYLSLQVTLIFFVKRVTKDMAGHLLIVLNDYVLGYNVWYN